MAFEWTDELNTGIDAIDAQHQKIVDYINRVELSGDDKAAVGLVLLDLIDYTVTHFTYEESLLEQAKYAYTDTHKDIHNRFIGKMHEYIEKYNSGESVAKELHEDLAEWLYGHILHEDGAYVASVKASMA